VATVARTLKLSNVIEFAGKFAGNEFSVTDSQSSAAVVTGNWELTTDN
jgi:uncharacterized protein YxjI